MENLEILEPAIFSEEIRKVEEEEFITAEIENEIKRKLLNNDVFLKELLEKLTKKTEDHIGSGVLHVTTEDKQNWNGKAGTSVATQQANGLMSNTDKAKLDGVATNAEVNQNAISSIKVGATVISSNAKTGQITIVAASNNVTITGDNATKQIKISVTGGNADTLGNHAPAYFAPATHNHDERYYTETEVNMLLNNKSNTNHTHAYIPTNASCNKNWNWSGQAGQPTWIWGSNDGTNMFVYNPSNFNVNYANSAGSVDWGNVKNIPGLSSGYVRNGQRMGSAIGRRATAEGIDVTASGDYAHGEGFNTKASGDTSHTEGNATTASGDTSHAEGYNTTASGDFAHAGGSGTIASGTEAVTYGKGTQATGWCSFAIGKYNKDPATAANTIFSPFMIGKGADNANRANAFRVHYTGVVYSTGAYNTTGADYAEYFEWLDKNLSNEDRVGYFVTLDGEKIRIATEKDDYILGIVSATPSVIGNSYDDLWIGREIRDEWGRIIYEEVEIEEERDEESNILQEARKEMQPKLNKDYDNTQLYIGRSQRKEWDAVGMLGQLLVRDDGTCQVNSYCKCGKEGVATASEAGYRVLARVSDNIIKVLFR